MIAVQLMRRVLAYRCLENLDLVGIYDNAGDDGPYNAQVWIFTHECLQCVHLISVAPVHHAHSLGSRSHIARVKYNPAGKEEDAQEHQRKKDVIDIILHIQIVIHVVLLKCNEVQTWERRQQNYEILPI